MKMNKNRMLVLGYFGYANNQLDGQTVKTRDIYRLLEEQTLDSVDYYDTQIFQQNKLSIFRMLIKVCRCNNLIYLPAQNNLKVIFPIIYILSKLFKFKIHYFVVGGWLSEFICDKPKHKKMLSNISGIHVETKRLKKDLEQKYNLRNVDIFPNFRFSTVSSSKSPIHIHNETKGLRLVFVSRICEAKGLDTLKKLYELTKINGSDNSFTIAFYGQMTDDYFNNHLKNIPIYQYKGVLQPFEVISTLQQYDALIFPSHYEGEGCPGILVEAMFAGLPIIASNWKYNDEFVKDGVNGILCDTNNVSEYHKAISTLFNNPDILNRMSEAANKFANEFSAETACINLNNILKLQLS